MDMGRVVYQNRHSKSAIKSSGERWFGEILLENLISLLNGKVTSIGKAVSHE